MLGNGPSKTAQMPVHTRLRFRLLGEPQVTAENGAARALRISTRKGLAVLVYLAMYRGRAMPRAQVADLLWGHSLDRHARQNLRQCLMVLRRDLGAELAGVLMADDQTLALRSDAIEVDALEFDAAANATSPEARERCLEIPWAPLFNGFVADAEGFDDWAAGERERHNAVATRVFADLATRLDAEARGDGAIVAMEKLVRADPSEEDRHRRLLVLEAKYRGVDAAVARAKTLAAELKREVDVDPEPATLALIEEIRGAAPPVGGFQHGKAGMFARAPEGASTSPSAPGEAAPSHAASAPSNQMAGGSIETHVVASANWVRPHPEQVRLRRWSPSRVIAASGALMVIVALGLMAASKSHSIPDFTLLESVDPWRPPSTTTQTKSSPEQRNKRIIPIIVLPFEVDADSDPAVSALAEEITDNLINMLSRVDRLRVISRNTSRSFKGAPVDPAALGKELGVRYALEGSLRTRGDRLHVNVELVDTGTRLAVWSDQIARSQGDRQTMPTEIVIQIARALQIQTQRLEVNRAGPADPVQQLIDKGWVTMTGGGVTAEKVEQSRLLFEEALRRDTNSLQAQVGLAAYHVQQVSELLTPDAVAHIDTALRILEPAVGKDPDNENAYYYLARAQRNKNDFEAALRSFSRTIELNPSRTDAYAQMGLTLLFLRRPAEALENIQYAMRLSPKDPAVPFWLRFAAEAEIDLGHYAEATRKLERSVEMAPRQLRAWGVLVAVNALNGNITAAQKHMEKVRELGSQFSDEQLLERIGRLSRLGPNKVYDGFKLALASSSN